MFGSVLTIVRTPSRERRRFTAPIRTPSAVESRNDVFVRSTTMRVWPDSTASPSADFSSGAVNRSISPATATTWRSSSIGSWVSKNSGGILAPTFTTPRATRRARRVFRHGPPGSGGGSSGEPQPQDQLVAVGPPAGLDLVGDPLEDVPDARERGVVQHRLGAPGAQPADAQLEPGLARVDVDADRPRLRVLACVRGDRVGEQQRVVEAVDRALGPSGEHADHAAEDGTDERVVADAHRRRAGHRPRPTSPPSRLNVIRTSVCSSWPVPSSSDSASVAMSGRPRPRPGLSARGRIPRPRSVTTTVRWRSSMWARTPIGPSSPGYAWTTTFVHASVTASLMSDSAWSGMSSTSPRPPNAWRTTATFSARAGSVSSRSGCSSAKAGSRNGSSARLMPGRSAAVLPGARGVYSWVARWRARAGEHIPRGGTEDARSALHLGRTGAGACAGPAPGSHRPPVP